MNGTIAAVVLAGVLLAGACGNEPEPAGRASPAAPTAPSPRPTTESPSPVASPAAVHDPAGQSVRRPGHGTARDLAYGLRNPWRYSFDRETGDLWIADVGQDEREEIDFQPASSSGGEHYGWDGYEGSLPFEPPLPDDAVPPVYDYGRELGATVIGGFVYRGSAIPALRGAYVFGDFFEPPLRALVVENGRLVDHRLLGPTVESLSAFGEDHRGELYALSLSGSVYRLVARGGPSGSP